MDGYSGAESVGATGLAERNAVMHGAIERPKRDI